MAAWESFVAARAGRPYLEPGAAERRRRESPARARRPLSRDVRIGDSPLALASRCGASERQLPEEISMSVRPFLFVARFCAAVAGDRRWPPCPRGRAEPARCRLSRAPGAHPRRLPTRRRQRRARAPAVARSWPSASASRSSSRTAAARAAPSRSTRRQVGARRLHAGDGVGVADSPMRRCSRRWATTSSRCSRRSDSSRPSRTSSSRSPRCRRTHDAGAHRAGEGQAAGAHLRIVGHRARSRISASSC